MNIYNLYLDPRIVPLPSMPPELNNMLHVLFAHREAFRQQSRLHHQRQRQEREQRRNKAGNHRPFLYGRPDDLSNGPQITFAADALLC